MDASDQEEVPLELVFDVMQVALGNQERTTATDETRRLMGDPDSDVCKVVDAIRERVRHAFDMNRGLPARALDDPDFAAYWNYMETKRPKKAGVEQRELMNASIGSVLPPAVLDIEKPARRVRSEE